MSWHRRWTRFGRGSSRRSTAWRAAFATAWLLLSWVTGARARPAPTRVGGGRRRAAGSAEGMAVEQARVRRGLAARAGGLLAGLTAAWASGHLLDTGGFV